MALTCVRAVGVVRGDYEACGSDGLDMGRLHVFAAFVFMGEQEQRGSSEYDCRCRLRRNQKDMSYL